MAVKWQLFLQCFTTLFLNGFCSMQGVGWSFDKREGWIIIPEYETASNFRADISPLGSDIDTVLPDGYVNKCVFVDGKSFNLATDLRTTCLRDIDQCHLGLGLTFLLKVEAWNDATNPVILRTTNLEPSDAGIYVGKEGDDITVYLRGSSGKTYSKSFSQSLVWRQWSRIHIYFVGTLIVSVNGTTVQGFAKGVLNAASDPAIPANFTVGAKNGPTFYLDEVLVVYPLGSSLTHAILATSTNKMLTTYEPTTKAPTTTTATTKRPTTTTNFQQASESKVTTKETLKTTTKTTDAISSEVTFASSIFSTEREIEETTIFVTGNNPTGDLANIWIPIVIALLALLLLMCCFFWIFCLRRRRRSQGENLSRDGIPLAERKDGYVKASTIVPYQDDGSNRDTEDNQTDDEGHDRQLLKERQHV